MPAIAPDPVSELDHAITFPPHGGIFPWQDPKVRDDVMLQLNVVIPERMMKQLEWLCFKDRTTKRALVQEALQFLLEEKLPEHRITPN